MSYWRLHYHLVWATRHRAPLLDEFVERAIHGAILGKAQELGVDVHAIGNVENHIHVAASIPPKIAVADCVKHFKGASSHYVNHLTKVGGDFAWQDGYGALSFGERAMADVVAYVRDQKEHHRRETTRAPFERMTAEDDGAKTPRVS